MKICNNKNTFLDICSQETKFMTKIEEQNIPSEYKTFATNFWDLTLGGANCSKAVAVPQKISCKLF